MFDRYTEKARRTVFWARHEASELGALYIEAEHLLLGLLRSVMRKKLKTRYQAQSS